MIMLYLGQRKRAGLARCLARRPARVPVSWQPDMAAAHSRKKKKNMNRRKIVLPTSGFASSIARVELAEDQKNIVLRASKGVENAKRAAKRVIEREHVRDENMMIVTMCPANSVRVSISVRVMKDTCEESVLVAGTADSGHPAMVYDWVASLRVCMWHVGVDVHVPCTI